MSASRADNSWLLLTAARLLVGLAMLGAAFWAMLFQIWPSLQPVQQGPADPTAGVFFAMFYLAVAVATPGMIVVGLSILALGGEGPWRRQ